MVDQYITYPGAGSVSFTEAATQASGSAGLPAVVKITAGYDGSFVRVLSTDATGKLNAVIASSALPTGAATEATLSTLNGKITACNTGAVTVSSSALPTGAATETTLAAASAKLPATLGQKTMAASMAVAIASDQGAVPISNAGLPAALGQSTMANSLRVVLASDQSAVSVTDTRLPAALGQGLMAASLPVTIASNQSALAISAASLPLPTGAALDTTLSTMSGKLPASLGSKTSATSLSVVLASDHTLAPNIAGGTTATFVCSNGTPITILTAANAPANSIGCIIQCISTSVGPLRWCAGSTATATNGFQLQPGQDTGYLPIAANLSLFPESTSCEYAVQWITK